MAVKETWRLPKITIYDKYVFKQVLFATVAAVLLFTVVWIAPEMLLNTIKRTISGVYDFKTAIMVLVYELPKILGRTLPGGLLLGTLFTFDKLSKDSEVTILRAVGISFQRIAAPVVLLSLMVTGLCFVIYDKLIPISAQKLNAIHGSRPSTQYIYNVKDDEGVPVTSVIVSRYQDKRLENVIVLDFARKVYADVHQLSDIYFAKHGTTLPDRWNLTDITHYKISEDGIYFYITNINQMDILQGQTAQDARTLMEYSARDLSKQERTITNAELWSYITLLKKEGLDEEYRYMLNKYFQRFISPFVCVLLSLMGVILGFSKPREQKIVGFTIAIGAIALYYITLPCFDTLAEKGVLHPFLTAIIPSLAFLAATVAFYKSKDL